jgi:general secretion pathway protein K
MALVMVLWILLLVSISTGAYTLMARMDQLEAHTVLAGTRARLAAEAGLNLAVLSLRDPNEEARIIADGRPYTVQFDEVTVEVRVTDERGKLDINSADEATLQRLFTANGLDAAQAAELSAAVLDWIDPDEAERPYGAEYDTYAAEGLAVGPGNRPFIMIEELLQVLGMSYELFTRMAAGLTVHSESGRPDPAYAPLEALLALPDMTEEDALNFIEQRQSEDQAGGAGAVLPDGRVAMRRGRGLTYSILAKATLPGGVWDQVEATIRLGSNEDGVPYRTLRWNEGYHH